MLNVLRIIGLYLDGVFVEGIQLPYPHCDTLQRSTLSVQYKIGNHSTGPNVPDDISWCLASAYLLGFPLRMYALVEVSH